jgi:hypothetical protein
MNAHTLNAQTLRKYAVALVSIVLLAAAGPLSSAGTEDARQLACNSTSCGG